MQSHSLTGNVYFSIFTDDYIWNTSVYFLKQKSQVLLYSKGLKAMVVKESGKYIKLLRSDRCLLLILLYSRMEWPKGKIKPYVHGSEYSEGETSTK